jgi:excisionase family DNA binding protein
VRAREAVGVAAASAIWADVRIVLVRVQLGSEDAGVLPLVADAGSDAYGADDHRVNVAGPVGFTEAEQHSGDPAATVPVSPPPPAEPGHVVPLLDAKGAAALLNVPATWVLAEARADRIPHVRLGRYVRFDAGELQAWPHARRAARGGG